MSSVTFAAPGPPMAANYNQINGQIAKPIYYRPMRRRKFCGCCSPIQFSVFLLIVGVMVLIFGLLVDTNFSGMSNDSVTLKQLVRLVLIVGGNLLLIAAVAVYFLPIRSALNRIYATGPQLPQSAPQTHYVQQLATPQPVQAPQFVNPVPLPYNPQMTISQIPTSPRSVAYQQTSAPSPSAPPSSPPNNAGVDYKY